MSHPLQKIENSVAMMSSFLMQILLVYEEAASEQVWQNAMVEYNSIMKNSIWEIVLKPIKNSVIDLKWLYIVKH